MKNILFLLLLLSLTSCKKEDNPVENNTITLEIVPTKIGNRWIGAITRYDTTETISSISNDTIWISRDTIIQGNKYFTFLESQYIPTRPSGAISRIHLYDARNTSSGLVGWFSPGDTIVYKYPARIGESYVFVIDTSITVPAGTFKCIGYKVEALPTTSNPFGIRSIAFLSPNVGFIKSELFMSSDYSPILYHRNSYELVNYKLE